MKQEITPEKQRELDKLARGFIAKSLWNGMHHGLMAVVMNIVLVMGVAILFDRDTTVATIGSVVIGIFVFRRMLQIHAQDFKQLHADAEKIIKK